MKQFLTVLCALLCFPMLTRAQYEVEQVFSDDQRTAPGFRTTVGIGRTLSRASTRWCRAD